jgi:hypothetical protein
MKQNGMPFHAFALHPSATTQRRARQTWEKAAEQFKQHRAKLVAMRREGLK